MMKKITLAFALSLSPLFAVAASSQSVYTTLSLEQTDCPVVEQSLDEGWSVNRCAGVGGYQLLVEYSDDRMSATVEDPAGQKYPLRFGELIDNGFSSIGDKAEWRVSQVNGKQVPHALIIRFNPETENGLVSYLSVSKITANSSCLTEVIPPGKDANMLARSAADRAATQPCLEKYSAEIELLLDKAQAGDAFSQRALALRYQTGDGLPVNLPEAVHWYGRSAYQGYDVAQNDLGYLSGNGIGMPKDLEQAKSWYAKAASQGNQVAQSNLRALIGENAIMPIRCPDVINTSQSWSKPLSGWTSEDENGPNAFLYLNVFDGNPDQESFVAYDDYREDPQNEQAYAEWRIPPANRGNLWISCAYDNTHIRLIKQLPPEITTCKVTYSSLEQQKGYSVIEDMLCEG